MAKGMAEQEMDDGGVQGMDVEEEEEVAILMEETVDEFKQSALDWKKHRKEAQVFWSKEGCYVPKHYDIESKEREMVKMSPRTEAAKNKVEELLRHYWGCFPLTSPHALTKARRMRDTLSRVEFRESDSFAPSIRKALSHAKENIPVKSK